MHERTPEEETTNRLAITALALAQTGARAQDICNAIDVDCRNAGLTLSRRQLGLMAQHAVAAARKEKREGRPTPTTTPDAPTATPASDPPVVTSTTQARIDPDLSAGTPIVPAMPTVDETPLGHAGKVKPKDGDYHIETIARPFTQIPNLVFALPRTKELTLPAQALLTQICRRTYGYHRYLSRPVSKKELAEDCNMGEGSVVNAMRELEEKAIIQRLQQTDRHGLKAKNLIRITIEAEDHQ